ncbi:MAG: sugar phosphate isomerase/epimerase [Planctomycetes bacterium]|nr:sugar phosphate isomerase/epimerase [Planctomycetota bacterium]
MPAVLRGALRLLVLVACLCARPAHAEVSLLVYDFNLGPVPATNVDTVKALGYSGIVTGIATPGDLPKLQAYAQRVAPMQGFRLLAFVYYDFNDANAAQLWKDTVPILAGVGAPLWVIVKNAPTQQDVRDLLYDMARRTAFHGVETVLYPHWATSIETAAEAATLIAQVGHPNLKSSLHTCHEIRAGNQYTLPAVVAAHASETALVTIAGAEDKAYAGPLPGTGMPWTDAIAPLDHDDFSLQPFLQALKDAHYDGPVILHTFGITNDPGHLERSLRRYAQYRSDLH